MATLTIDIPAGVQNRVVDAMAAMHGYQATVPNPANPDGQDIPNPQTKLQFVKAHLVEYIKQTVVTYEAQQAASAAYTTASNEITVS